MARLPRAVEQILTAYLTGAIAQRVRLCANVAEPLSRRASRDGPNFARVGYAPPADARQAGALYTTHL